MDHLLNKKPKVSVFTQIVVYWVAGKKAEAEAEAKKQKAKAKAEANKKIKKERKKIVPIV